MTNDIRVGNEARACAAVKRFALAALAPVAFLVSCSSPHDAGEDTKAVSEQVTAVC